LDLWCILKVQILLIWGWKWHLAKKKKWNRMTRPNDRAIK
jgi:hypothetical protein